MRYSKLLATTVCSILALNASAEHCKKPNVNDTKKIKESKNPSWEGWYVGGGLGFSTLSEDYNQTQHTMGACNLQNTRYGGLLFEAFGGVGTYIPDSKVYTGVELRLGINTNKPDINETISDGKKLIQTAKIKCIGELAGRLGYKVWDDSMAYGRVGITYLGFNNEQKLDVNIAGHQEKDYGNHEGTAWGLKFGLGIERVITKGHLIRLEANYMITQSEDIKAIVDDATGLTLLSGKIQFRSLDVALQYVYDF